MKQLEHRNELIDKWNDRIIDNNRSIWNNNKYTVNKCIQDLTNLLGSNVAIFGQKIKLNSKIPEFSIDTREWLENVEGNEIDLMDIAEIYHLDLNNEYYKICDSYYDKKTFWEKLENDELDSNNVLMQILVNNGIFEELDNHCGNTYNWNSTVYNDIQWQGYRKIGDDENYYYLVSIHKYGDTRGNYTDDIVLCFDYDIGIIESMTDTRLFKDIEVNGILFNLDTDISNETLNCYNEYDEELWYDLLGYDRETIIESIEEKIKEQVDKLEIGKHIELKAISNKELFEKLNDENKMYGYINYEIKNIDYDKQVFYIDIDNVETEIKFTDIFEIID